MTQEVLKLALDALIWTTGSGDFGEGGYAHEGAKKCLFPAITAIKEALAQEQEPLTENGMYRLGYHNGYGFGEAYGKANAPQRTEQNFCSRCGKRTADLTTIHTCTPPQD